MTAVSACRRRLSPKTLFPFLGLLCFSFLSPPYSLATGPQPADGFLSFTHDAGLCMRSLFMQINWDPAASSEGAPVWDSFCGNDSFVGKIVSDPFLAPSTMSLSLAGYAGTPGLRLYLRNLESQEEFDFHPQPAAGDHWHSYTFALPDRWVGKPVQLIGEDNATGFDGWFAFSAPRLPYSSLARGYLPTSRPPSGFCTNSKFPQLTWGTLPHPAGLVTWRSRCGAGDNDTGSMASEPFTAGSELALYLAGYPGRPGLRISVEDLSSGQQLPLQVTNLPRELWRLEYFPLPPQWKGHPLRILAEDQATGPGGWLAFAVPQQSHHSADFALRLLLLYLGVLLATMLPATAACSLAARRGITGLLDLTTIALLAIGLVGYVSFWLYFYDRRAGHIYSWATLLISIAIVIWAALESRKRLRLPALWRIARPWLLVAAAALFVVNLGFLYGKYHPLQEYSAERFGPPILSVDNWLPKVLADDIYEGHIPKPMVGDWLSSDRPPLQSGDLLWHYAWLQRNRDVSYQILGTILQLTFLAALWAYLDAAGLGRSAMLLVMVAALFAGFTIENSFFVWPKLFSAAFLLIIAAYLFTSRYTTARTDWRVGVVVGSAASCAMLGHGGSAFGLIGIGLTLLALRRVPTLRFCATAALAAVLIYLPWSLYQKYYDPPGDRLLKMHLAGTPQPRPDITFGRLVIQKYKEAGWHGLVKNKRQSFAGLFDVLPFRKRARDVAQLLLLGDSQQRAAEVGSLRDTIFMRWFWSIDLLSFVILVWLVRLVWRRPLSPEFRQASLLWICIAFTLLAWCLLMFVGGTIVHQGCYFTEIAAFAAAVLTLWAISPRLASIVVACHVALTFALYVFLEPSRPLGLATTLGPVNYFVAWCSALGAAGFVVLLWCARDEQPEGAAE